MDQSIKSTTSNKIGQDPIVIIGGGITGLATAWYLQKAGIPYLLFEKSNRFGGKILTETIEEFIIEAGPDSFITQKPWALDLARELALQPRFLPTNDQKRKTFVLSKGNLIPFPDGMNLVVPTRIWPFLMSPLISPIGKLRMGLDYFIAPKTDNEDESLADFARRRLGKEALDKLVEPLLAGIYSSDPEAQSLLASFPRFRAIEQKYGSLIKGMRHIHKNRPTKDEKLSIFLSFKNGMQELVNALVLKLHGDLQEETAVTKISRLNNQYQIELDNGTRIETKNVIITTPTNITANLLKDIAPQAIPHLRKIRYVSTGTISLAYRRQDITHPLNGFGVLIPDSEKRPINAISWTSTKFDHRAPANHILIRLFFGGSRNPQIMKTGDDEIRALAQTELKRILNIDKQPLFDRIYRWPQANPQYDLNHLDTVSAIENALPKGIFVTGSAYRGIGIPDCIHQAKETVAQLIRELI